MQAQDWTLVLYLSSLLGILGSFWILQEKRLPQNVFKTLIHTLAIVDAMVAVALAVFGYLFTALHDEISSQDASIQPIISVLLVAVVFLAYLYYFVGFCIAFIPVYIIVFKGTVNALNRLPLVSICLVGAVSWTVIIAIGLFGSNYVRVVSGLVFLFAMFALMWICFYICWKELNADKTQRKNVQTLQNFNEREFYSKQASVKMTRFTGSFALIQLTLILPALLLGVLMLLNIAIFQGDNGTISEIISISILAILVSFSASGLFHSLAVKFSLFYKYRKWKLLQQRQQLPRALPKHKLATTTFKEADLPHRPDMVHLFTGQRPTLIQPDTIELIKG